MHVRRLALITAALAVVGACQLATDFSVSPVTEASDELCSDGKDNNFDGLTDCQDWTCLGQRTCCDLPEVVLFDTFDSGPATCDDDQCTEVDCTTMRCGPDIERWHTWPCPYAKVCGGALHIDKASCFAAGVVSQQQVELDRGLKVDITIAGQPEVLGFLEVALTLQDKESLVGSATACGSPQTVDGFAVMRVAAAGDGYAVTAIVRQREIATSRIVSDTEMAHRLTLQINEDRMLVYSLDGDSFAVAGEPIPPTGELVRVALVGLTEQVVVTEAKVQSGLRCHDPKSWQLAGLDVDSSVVLSGSASTSYTFDNEEVFHPAVRKTSSGSELYYTGCSWPAGATECDWLAVGIGLARSTGASGYLRTTTTPLLRPDDFPDRELGSEHYEMSVSLVPGETQRGFIAPGGAEGAGIYAFSDDITRSTLALPVGEPGSWDGWEVVGATAYLPVNEAGMVWYAARAARQEVRWEIGLATASADGVFARHGSSPVLSPGPAGAFDSEAVLNPSVLYDPKSRLYRMWYEGRDFFGKSGIGYAVSTDGVNWSKYPGNPAIASGTLGLISLGGPDVHLDDDGLLHAWLHATTNDERQRRIFALENLGKRAEQVPPESAGD